MTSPLREFPLVFFRAHLSLPASTVSNAQLCESQIRKWKYISEITLRTKPGVSMIVRLGQWAYSDLITIGLEETAVLVFFSSVSVRDFMVSAIADAKPTGLPYSSESSSCFNYQISISFVRHSFILILHFENSLVPKVE